MEVTMPDTGDGGAAQLVAWLREPGEPIEADEPICMVRLGELQAQVASPAAGVIAAVMAEPGQVVSSGASLAEILVPVEDAEPEPELEPIAVEPAVPDPLANLATEIGTLELQVPEFDVRWQPPEAEPDPPRQPLPNPEPPAPVTLRTFRSPAVRRIAADLGIALDEIVGTGRHGRVTREDVLAARK